MKNNKTKHSSHLICLVKTNKNKKIYGMCQLFISLFFNSQNKSRVKENRHLDEVDGNGGQYPHPPSEPVCVK